MREVVTPHVGDNRLRVVSDPRRGASRDAAGHTGDGAGAQWVGRVARLLHPVAGQAAPRAASGSLIEHIPRSYHRLDLDGLPVLLVGGLVSTPDSLEVLRKWLLRLNARPQVSPNGYGVDCGERTTRQVADAALSLADRTGRPCVLLGHSRGGQFARTVAVRHPEEVGGLITLGSPVNRMVGVRPILRAELAMLGTLGTLGAPGLLGWSCLWGRCCRQLRADLLAPVLPDVPYLAIYTQHDEYVSWRSCLDPWARHRAVTASHSGMLRSAEVLEVLASELAELAGAAHDGRRRLRGRYDRLLAVSE